MIGIGNHASAYSCLYCEQKTAGAGAWNEDGNPPNQRTLGRLQKCFHDFLEIGKGKKENAKSFFNCIHAPILKGEDTTEVIDLVPPPGKFLCTNVHYPLP